MLYTIKYQTKTILSNKILPDIQHYVLFDLIISKLIQLVSPESIILKLPTFEDKVEQWLCNLYFQQQEHFNIEHFIQQLLSNPLEQDDLSPLEIHTTTKVMIFTRTSSYVVGLNQRSKTELFNENAGESKKIDILNLVSILFEESKVIKSRHLGCH